MKEDPRLVYRFFFREEHGLEQEEDLKIQQRGMHDAVETGCGVLLWIMCWFHM